MTPDLRAVERPAERSHPPLNLFAFPSETRGWFRMLIVAAGVVGLNLGFLAQEIAGGRAQVMKRERILAQYAAEIGHPDPRFLDRKEITDLSHKLPALAGEMLRREAPRLIPPTLLALFLTIVATAIYLRHPKRVRRRYFTQPLLAEHAPRVIADLQQYAAQCGLPPLRLEVRPGIAEAQTFGLRGREVLLLAGTPQFLEASWSDTARAIAMHEIGHIKNGHAQDREKSRAIWLALLRLLVFGFGAAVIVILLGTVARLAAGNILAAGAWLVACAVTAFGIVWRFAAMLLLVKMIWGGMVRAHEFYADWRVASWGLRRPLEHLLRLPEPRHRWRERSRAWDHARDRWGHRREWIWLERALDRISEPVERLWKFHPSYQLRREALADPTRLFRVSSRLSFVTGALFSLVLVNLLLPMFELTSFFSLFGWKTYWALVAPLSTSVSPLLGKQILLLGAVALIWAPVCLFVTLLLGSLSYMLAQTLGVQVQREAVADLARGRRAWGYLRLLRPAVLLALGLEAGLLVVPFGGTLSLPLELTLLPFWLTGLTCFIWLWLAYVRALTRFTLGLHVGSHLPRRLPALVTGSSVALLTVLYWPAGFARLTLWISHWTFPTWLVPPGASPQELFAYMFVMTGHLLAFFAVLVYVAWAGVTLLAICPRLLRRRPQCPTCGDPARIDFALGRSCNYCGEPMAAWAYVNDANDGADPERGDRR